MGFVGIRFEYGQCVLCEYDSSGVLKAQPDGAGVAPQVASYDVMWPLGFAARAPVATADSKGKPIGGGGCNILIGKDGTEYRVQLMGDYRDLVRIPPLPVEGGSVQYAPGCQTPSFHTISSKDGTHQIYVEVGDSAHVITIGRDANDEAVLEITHSRGMALTFFKDKAVLKNRTGNVYAELNDDGGILNGNWKVTGAFDVGAVSFPLTKFAELAAWVTAAQAALAAIAAVPVNSGAASGPVGVAGGFATAFIGGGATTMTKGF